MLVLRKLIKLQKNCFTARCSINITQSNLSLFSQQDLLIYKIVKCKQIYKIAYLLIRFKKCVSEPNVI